jgi:pimeloyl-ACP methyl ester carboxylesterase
MNLYKLYIVHIILSTALGSCASSPTKDLPAHRVVFLNGSSNNKLEVLDWGGTGKPLFFLTGLGNSAHVYDNFAPKFTDKFHVFALTRRGFGSSMKTKAGYNIKTLDRDILAIIDSLHLQKVILIGHSVAGEEISSFASSYPDRVEKIIYLDAAYDRTSPSLSSLNSSSPQSPMPATEDSSSLDHLKHLYQKSYGLSFPEDEWKQIFIFSNDGKYLKNATPDSIAGAIAMSVQHPDYLHITCPALAIYAAANSVERLVPYYSQLNSANRKKAEIFFMLFHQYSTEEQVRFKKEVRKGTTKVISGANHYIFISNEKETEKIIRQFLK